MTKPHLYQCVSRESRVIARTPRLHVLYHKTATTLHWGAMIPHPLGFMSFRYCSGVSAPHDKAWHQQHRWWLWVPGQSRIQPNTAARILAPCPKRLSGAHQNWSRSSPNKGREKYPTKHQAFLFKHIWHPGYIALKRPPTTDSPPHLPLKEYISGTGRGAGCLDKVHRRFVEQGCSSCVSHSSLPTYNPAPFIEMKHTVLSAT